MKELEIYRLLPGKNCKECSPGTCMAFAIKLNKEPHLLEECPYIDSEKKVYLKNNLVTSDWRDDLIESLSKEVSRMDFNDIASDLGALLHKDGLIIKCIGKDYLIKKDGTVISDKNNKWIKILLLHYIRTSGKGGLRGRWISFSEMKGGFVKASTFKRDCEDPLRESFDSDPDRTLKVLEKLGGKRVEGYPADIAVITDLLPKVRMLVLYSRGDEEFSSSLKILFDAITPDFLDIESLIFLTEGLVHTLNHLKSDFN